MLIQIWSVIYADKDGEKNFYLFLRDFNPDFLPFFYFLTFQTQNSLLNLRIIVILNKNEMTSQIFDNYLSKKQSEKFRQHEI